MKRDQRVYKIGKWAYEPDTGRFLNGHVEYFIELRLKRLLNKLLEHPNEVVKRNKIIDEVWSDTVVSEENLTKGIADLRKFLRSIPDHELNIETIRNIGYRITTSQNQSKKGTLVIIKIAKVFAYVIGIFLFLAMLIRAIKY